MEIPRKLYKGLFTPWLRRIFNHILDVKSPIMKILDEVIKIISESCKYSMIIKLLGKEIDCTIHSDEINRYRGRF